MKKLFIFLISALILTAGAVATTIDITPTVAYNDDALTCAVDPSPEAYTYKWFYNGNYVKTGQILESSNTEPLQTWTCKVYLPPTPWTSEIFIGEVSRTISQSNPTAPALTISSGPYYANSAITATASGSTDPEGNSITYEYQFVRGGTVLSSANTLNCAGTCHKGDAITVSARAYNGNSYSNWQTATFAISNSNPYNLNIAYTPSVIYTSSTITVTASANDIDADTLAYSFRFENLNDSLILQDYSAVASYTFDAASLNDTVRISARASDGTSVATAYVDVVVYGTSAATGGTGTNQTASTFQYCSTGSTSSPITLKEVKKTDIDGKSFNPLEKITIKTKVENTDDENSHEAVVEAVLIHDESRLSDSEADTSVDIDNDDTESVELELEIPSDAEAGSYYLAVRAYNDDNENNCQEVRIPLSVKRKSNDVILTEVTLPETVYIDSEFSVDGEIANIGNEEEDKVKVVYTDDTGNSYSKEIENLEEGDLDTFSFLMNIPLNATLGTHTAKITIYFEYDEDDDEYNSEDSTEYTFSIAEKSETAQKAALKTEQKALEQEVSTTTNITAVIKEKWLVLIISLIDAILVIYAISLILKKF